MTTTIFDGTTSFSPFTMSPFSTTAVSQNIWHSVVGSSNAEVTLQTAALPSGSLTAAFYTQADAAAFRDALRQSVVFQVSSDEDAGLNFTFATNGSITLAVDVDSLQFWTVTWDFQEVPA